MEGFFLGGWVGEAFALLWDHTFGEARPESSHASLFVRVHANEVMG